MALSGPPPALVPHPRDGLPLLGPRRTWALELGALSGVVGASPVGLLLLMMLEVGGMSLDDMLLFGGMAVASGVTGWLSGTAMGAWLWGVLRSRWPLSLAHLHANLLVLGGVWGGLLAGGGCLASALVVASQEHGFWSNLTPIVLFGGVSVGVGALLGALSVPVLVGAYLQAWLDRFGRRTVLLVMGGSAALASLAAVLLVLLGLRG